MYRENIGGFCNKRKKHKRIIHRVCYWENIGGFEVVSNNTILITKIEWNQPKNQQPKIKHEIISG